MSRLLHLQSKTHAALVHFTITVLHLSGLIVFSIEYGATDHDAAAAVLQRLH